MELEKSKTVAFSGYRPKKFDFPMTGDMYDKLVHELLNIIIKTVEAGYLNFVIGCAPGFDIVSGELVRIARKVTQKKIKLVCVLPFNDFINSSHFNEEWKVRLESLLMDSDSVINVFGKDKAFRGCYQKRNIFLIDNSSKLICYYTGKKGGTADTVQYAMDNGLEVVNIAKLIK